MTMIIQRGTAPSFVVVDAGILRARAGERVALGAPVAHKSTFRPVPLGLGGCGKDAAPKPGPVVGTDLEALGRLIKLPAEVTHAEWQTGPMAEHGGDWWVAAVLDVLAGRMAATKFFVLVWTT